MPPELSIVVPVHNEADNLSRLTEEIRRALDGRVDYEIVYVDDGSDDGSAEGLARLATEKPGIRLVRHRERAGQSAAIVSGVEAARAPWIATLDGDGQNDPADILPMLDMVQNSVRLSARPPVRLIIGNRRRRRDRWDKRMAGRIANVVRSRVLGDGTPDTGCGLKLFERSAFMSVPHFNHMHRYLPALFLRSGWGVASVPVNHRPRGSGRSHYGVLDRLWVGLLDLPGVWWLMRRQIRPAIAENSHDT
ncbi:MAG: glycosyltransferase family 2 protein [Gemmatimonadales bacterium]